MVLYKCVYDTELHISCLNHVTGISLQLLHVLLHLIVIALDLYPDFLLKSLRFQVNLFDGDCYAHSSVDYAYK